MDRRIELFQDHLKERFNRIFGACESFSLKYEKNRKPGKYNIFSRKQLKREIEKVKQDQDSNQLEFSF